MGGSSGRIRIAARVGVEIPKHERMLMIPRGGQRAAALGVWLVATCFSRERELDGFCPAEALDGYARPESLQNLISVGLFAESEKNGVRGYTVVKFAEFNETKDEITSRLEKDRARKAARKAGHFPPGIRPEDARKADSGLGSGIGSGIGIGSEITDHRSKTVGEGPLPTSALTQEKFWKAAYERGVDAERPKTLASYGFPAGKLWFDKLVAVVEKRCTGEARQDIDRWIEQSVREFMRATKYDRQESTAKDPCGPDYWEAWHGKRQVPTNPQEIKPHAQTSPAATETGTARHHGSLDELFQQGVFKPGFKVQAAS